MSSARNTYFAEIVSDGKKDKERADEGVEKLKGVAVPRQKIGTRAGVAPLPMFFFDSLLSFTCGSFGEIKKWTGWAGGKEARKSEDT